MSPSRVLMILGAFLLQSCTVAYYDLRNELKGPEKPKLSCFVKYSVDLVSGGYTNTFGFKETKKEWMEKEKQRFVADTRDVLSAKGCEAAYVQDENSATLQIQVKHLAYVSALPQEWLTGLSFGLIPSWGTRPSEYTYVFDDKSSGWSHTYTVDNKSYNHLILFPVFWISFFTLDENRVYKNALNNFLGHS
jgi:hypothetical protein